MAFLDGSNLFNDDNIILRPIMSIGELKQDNDKGIIDGMGNVLKSTSYISMKNAISPEEKVRLKMKVFTISDTIMDRIRRYIKSDKYSNWDDVRSYLSIPNLGIQRLQLIVYALTGQEVPPIIIQSYVLYEEVLKGGVRVKDGYQPNPVWKYYYGNTIVDVSHIKDRYSTHHELTLPLKDLMATMSNKWLGFKNEDGKTTHLMVKSFYEAEQEITENCQTPSMIKPRGKLTNDTSGFPYTQEQLDAIEGVLSTSYRFSCMVGAGGTGKSVTIAGVVNSLNEGLNVGVFTPTGASAKRLQNSEIPLKRLSFGISTIHSGIMAMRREDADILDVIIIDEATMLDTNICSKMLKQIDENCQIILVGDPSQLESVSAGRVFADLVMTKICPVFELTKVLRTTNAKMLEFFEKIRNEELIHPPTFKEFFIPNEGQYELQNEIVRVIKQWQKEDKHWYRTDAIISHRNSIVDFVNYYCFRHYSGMTIPEWENATILDKPNKPIQWYFKGAKVVFLDNDKDLGGVGVVNGDVGEVTRMVKCKKTKAFDKYKVTITLYDGKEVEIDSTYDMIRLAYALTVHKSQGSEYENIVYIHLNKMESRNLVYTAVTRAKKDFKVMTLGYEFKITPSERRFTFLNMES